LRNVGPDHLRNTLLPDVVNKINKKIEEKLKTALSVSIIFDLWSNKMNTPFIGVAAARETIILGTKKIEGTHSAENVKMHLESIVNQFDFNKNTIHSTVVDGGSVMIKLFKQLYVDAGSDDLILDKNEYNVMFNDHEEDFLEKDEKGNIINNEDEYLITNDNVSQLIDDILAIDLNDNSLKVTGSRESLINDSLNDTLSDKISSQIDDQKEQDNDSVTPKSKSKITITSMKKTVPAITQEEITDKDFDDLYDDDEYLHKLEISI
jgi:hypothetical protein